MTALTPTVLRARVLAALRVRLRAGALTQREAASLAGCSQPHIANIVSGTRLLADPHVEELIENLNLAAHELYSADERACLRCWIDGRPCDRPDCEHHADRRGGRPQAMTAAVVTIDRQARRLRRGRVDAGQLDPMPAA